MAEKKKLKRITIHLDGHDEDHEGFHVEHEFEQTGEGHYEPPKNMGAMSSHGELMDQIHDHIKGHGADCADGDCGMCGGSAEGSKMNTSKNMTHHGYKKGSSGDPKTKSTKKDGHPGFKKVAADISSKEHLSSKAAGAILAARTRGASASAHKANPHLNRVKG